MVIPTHSQAYHVFDNDVYTTAITELPPSLKQRLINRTALFSTIGLVVSIALFVLPYFMSSTITSLQQILLIIIVGGLNFIVSLLALSWTRSRQILSRSILAKNDQQDFTIFYNPMGDAAFGLGLLQIFLNVLAFIAPIFLYDVNKAKYIATSGSSTIGDFNTRYIVFFSIIAFLLLIMLGVLAIIVNATLKCSATPKTFRIFGYIYNVK